MTASQVGRRPVAENDDLCAANRHGDRSAVCGWTSVDVPQPSECHFYLESPV